MITCEVVAGAGHREFAEGGENWVRGQLRGWALWLRDNAGTRVGVSGMARGFDLWWADAVVAAGLDLHAYLPFAEQAERWPKTGKDKKEWVRLCALAAETVTVGVLNPDVPAKGRSTVVNRLLHARNDSMLAAATALVIAWDPAKLDGGTHSMVLKAARRQIPGIHLDPAARAVHTSLPVLNRVLPYTLFHRGCGCIAGVGILADAEARRAAFAAAGHHQWRIRPARPRETYGAGCPTCLTAPTLVTTSERN